MNSHDGATFSHKAGQNSAVCREADVREDHTTSKITQPQRGKYGMLFTHLWISNFTEIHKITDVWNTGKYKPECKDEWTQWEWGEGKDGRGWKWPKYKLYLYENISWVHQYWWEAGILPRLSGRVITAQSSSPFISFPHGHACLMSWRAAMLSFLSLQLQSPWIWKL